MKRALVFLFALLITGAALAETTTPIVLTSRGSVSLAVSGATAAYSLDTRVADASAFDGVLTITGREAGETTVVVVRNGGVDTLPVVVYDAGRSALAFSDPNRAPFESGFMELRYASSPGLASGALDLRRQDGDWSQRLRLVTARSATSRNGLSFPLASYEIARPGLAITLLDQTVVNSPLTVDGALVRGLHVQNGPWVLHAGVSSVATFRDLFVMTDPEYVAGISRRFDLSSHNSLTANVYGFRHAKHAGTLSEDGPITTLVYGYRPGPGLDVLAEIGGGHGGLAEALKVRYRAPGFALDAKLRIEDRQFPSLQLTQQNGRFADVSATRTSNATETRFVLVNSDYDLPLHRQRLFTTAGTITRRFSLGLSARSGITYSSFHSGGPIALDHRQVALPLGLDFSSPHFNTGLQYQLVDNLQGRHGRNLGANGGVRGATWSSSAFYRRNVDLPTIVGINPAEPATEALASRMAQESTPNQTNALLQDSAHLSAAGLAPLQFGIAASRTDRGLAFAFTRGGQRIVGQYLDSRTELASGRFRFNNLSITYSRPLGAGNSINATAGRFQTRTVAALSARSFVDLSFRRQLASTPSWLMPGRRGDISGRVLLDDTGTASGMPGVEVRLDDGRSTRTDAGGNYAFTRVPFGEHRLEAVIDSAQPFFFTTDSRVVTGIDKNVDFTISLLQSSIFGTLRNDAGAPIAGVTVAARGKAGSRLCVTRDDGTFELKGLPSGEYGVETVADSYPGGYAVESARAARVMTAPGAAGHTELTSRAARSISGRVVQYDTNLLRTVAVAGARVRLVELAIESITDANGEYLFRELPAGKWTIATSDAVTRGGTLSPSPVVLRNVDLNVGRQR